MQTLPQEGKIYLLDANVWLIILRPPSDLKDYEKAYVSFVDSILSLGQSPTCKKRPLIYVNALIISEVYNAFMRNHWAAYCATVQEIDLKEYRSTDDFDSNLHLIKSDFAAYSPFITTDSNLIFDPLEILGRLPFNTDYNDYYYYELAVEKQLTIVTNDKDFLYQGVDILTNNNKLLSI